MGVIDSLGCVKPRLRRGDNTSHPHGTVDGSNASHHDAEADVGGDDDATDDEFAADSGCGHLHASITNTFTRSASECESLYLCGNFQFFSFLHLEQ